MARPLNGSLDNGTWLLHNCYTLEIGEGIIPVVEPRRTSRLAINATPAERERWESAASAEQMRFQDWLRAAIDRTAMEVIEAKTNKEKKRMRLRLPEGWEFCHRHDSGEPRWVYPEFERSRNGSAYAIVAEANFGRYKTHVYLHDNRQRRHPAWQTTEMCKECDETLTIEEAFALGAKHVYETNRTNGLHSDPEAGIDLTNQLADISASFTLPGRWMYRKHSDEPSPRFVFPRMEDTPDGFAYAVVSSSNLGMHTVCVHLHDSNERRYPTWKSGPEKTGTSTLTLQEAIELGEFLVRKVNRTNGLPADWVEDGRRPTPLVSEG